MRGGQSSVHSLPDLQGRSAKTRARSVCRSRGEVLRTHGVMGSVPRSDSEPVETRRANGVRRARCHRSRSLCRAVARLSGHALRRHPDHRDPFEAVSGALGGLLAAPSGRLRRQVQGVPLWGARSFQAVRRAPARPSWSPVHEWRESWKRRLRPYLLPEKVREFYRAAASSDGSMRFGDIASIRNRIRQRRQTTSFTFGLPKPRRGESPNNSSIRQYATVGYCRLET